MSSAVNTSYVGVREDILDAVPAGDYRRVLDVGCASGATAALFRREHPGVHITGIELDPVLARSARECLDLVLEGDALSRLLELTKRTERFDLVFCGDVLEHLVDPWDALRKIRALCPEGTVIVSLPNIGHWSTLVTLLRGYWPYRERGLHDRTHLRFFSRNNLRELYEGAGFIEVERHTNQRLLERPHWINVRTEPLLRWMPVLRRLTEYQFISVLR